MQSSFGVSQRERLRFFGLRQNGDRSSLDGLPFGVRLNRGEGAPLPADASLFEIVNDYERRIIVDRLEQCSWSQTEAAESLHVPLSTLNQKIKRLDIKIKKKSEG